MPVFSPEFFVSLLGIIVADLVLAGDNAVVIALAARNLPSKLRARAVFIGATLAIALRAGLTIAAVFLLRGELPGIMLAGGIALLWIGWKLANEEDEAVNDEHAAQNTMRGAIKTIVVADIIMSIDNVLAVAAFAKDDAWLVVFGLLISIPIIMGGATLLLRLIDRFPIVVWLGSALIIYVGVELILQDPIIKANLPSFLEPTVIERSIGVVVGVIVATASWRFKVARSQKHAVQSDAQEVLSEHKTYD